MNGGCHAVKSCRACLSTALAPVVSLGLLPLANQYLPIGSTEPLQFYPHDMLRCETCGLAQLGITAPSSEVFERSYPYTSSTTRALRENFADLATEANALIGLAPEDLVIDIGGNDGNLLSNFVGKQRVLNVTPEDIGQLGVELGIPHFQDYWDRRSAEAVVAKHGKARLITATNVFAHITDPHAFVDAVLDTLIDDGVFVVEVQYLPSLLSGVQFDHLYLEHQMFWGLDPLRTLLARHDLTIAFARTINSHGGSIRVYATRPDYARKLSEKANAFPGRRVYQDDIDLREFTTFAKRVAESKVALWRLLSSIKEQGGRIYGIGAPSRAATLVNYCGIDHNVLDCIVETSGSYKLGKMMPGTKIPVVGESALYENQPEFALLLSWHLRFELAAALKERGFRGRFICPLPVAEVFQ